MAGIVGEPRGDEGDQFAKGNKRVRRRDAAALGILPADPAFMVLAQLFKINLDAAKGGQNFLRCPIEVDALDGIKRMASVMFNIEIPKMLLLSWAADVFQIDDGCPYGQNNVAKNLEFSKIIPKYLLSKPSTPFIYMANDLIQCSWLISYVDRSLVKRSQKKYAKKKADNKEEL